MERETIIIGAGPAGLSAAYELTRQGHPCRVLEADPTYVGGIARTVVYNGNRFDIGGHRFFTKNSEIEALWREILPEDFIEVDRLTRISRRNWTRVAAFGSWGHTVRPHGPPSESFRRSASTARTPAFKNGR